MGLRLVKKTVNQDNPTVYHLFFADEKGERRLGPDLLRVPGSAAGPRRSRRRSPDRLAGRLRGGARLLGGAPRRQRHRVRARGRRPALRRPRGPRARAARRRGPRRAADRRPPRGPGRGGAAGLPRRARLQRRRPTPAAACWRRSSSSPTASAWEARGSSTAAASTSTTSRRPSAALQGAGSVHHVAWASTARRARGVARRGDRRRRPADPGDRPLLLPLDLLPRAQRRPLRDRHARARASPSTSRSSTSARSSRCHPTTSTCAPRSNRTCARSSTRARSRPGERQLRLARRRSHRRFPRRGHRGGAGSCLPSTAWSRSSCSARAGPRDAANGSPGPRAPCTSCRRPIRPRLPRRAPPPLLDSVRSAANLCRPGRRPGDRHGEGGRLGHRGPRWPRSRRRCRGRR